MIHTRQYVFVLRESLAIMLNNMISPSTRVMRVSYPAKNIRFAAY